MPLVFSQVQIQLYSRLATEFSLKTAGSSGIDLREHVGVGQLFFILREYYSITGEGGVVGSLGEEAVSGAIREIRRYILLVVKNLVVREKGIESHEMESILCYLCTVPEVCVYCNARLVSWQLIGQFIESC